MDAIRLGKKRFFCFATTVLCFFFGELGGLEWRSLLLLIPCASLIRSYRVLLGFTAFHEVLPGFTRFYWVLLGFTGFYQVSIEFRRVLSGFTGL